MSKEKSKSRQAELRERRKELGVIQINAAVFVLEIDREEALAAMRAAAEPFINKAKKVIDNA